MKIIHIESGLGNQMLSYCEYLALKSVNPGDEFYLETMIYDIPECNDVICQWNGYELERIFRIEEPKNVKTLFSQKEWSEIIDDVRRTEFWKHNWNYPVAITDALNNAGLDVTNFRGDFSLESDKTCSDKQNWKAKIKGTRIGNAARRFLEKTHESQQIALFDNRDRLFVCTERNLFTGQWLSFCRKGNDRERIDSAIRETFNFPDFDDRRDVNAAEILERGNSVAVHVRRGDALYSNAWCYKYGYFKDSVNYIRRRVDNPIFVFFTDPDSVDWCKQNGKVFGIDFAKENVMFIDWHQGLDSFRDMQLMSHCKHAIITTSSFGWWGAYFMNNSDKITISPYLSIDTTVHL